MKLLTWDMGGFVYKRLEREQFKLPHMDPSTMAVEIDATQLAMLLDGIDLGVSGSAAGLTLAARCSRPSPTRRSREGVR